MKSSLEIAHDLRWNNPHLQSVVRRRDAAPPAVAVRLEPIADDTVTAGEQQFIVLYPPEKCVQATSFSNDACLGKLNRPAVMSNPLEPQCFAGESLGYGAVRFRHGSDKITNYGPLQKQLFD